MTWLCLAPAIAILSVTVLLGFGSSKRISWLKSFAAILIICCIWVVFAYLASAGEIGLNLSYMLGIPTVFVALLSGSILFFHYKGRQKLVALALGILFPCALLIALPFGYSFSTEAITKHNGDLIISALERYHVDRKTYPQSLALLIPEYLNELPEAIAFISDWNRKEWLYSTKNDGGYWLGFWYHPGQTEICSYQSETDEWECGLKHSFPYNLVSGFLPIP